MRERSRNDASVEAVIAAAGPGGARHSTLYLWMRRNHDSFARELDQRGANWAGLTDAFAQKGLHAANGQPASVRTAQQTWRRVRCAVADRVAKAPTKPTEAAPALTPERTPPVAPVRSGILDHEPDDYRPQTTYKLASLKGVPKPQ